MIKSFLGGELEGGRVLRLIYMDEAGTGDPKLEPYVVVAGVVVSGDGQFDSVEEYLGSLVEAYVPEDQQEGFVFHAHEIFNGRGKVFDQSIYPLGRRMELADRLSAAFQLLDLTVVFSSVSRDEPLSGFMVSQGKKADRHHGFAFLLCAALAEKFMRLEAPRENCFLVVEDIPKERKLLRAITKASQDKAVYGNDVMPYVPFRRIKEDPLFLGKRSTNPLELADYAAYVYKRWIAGKEDMDRFMHPIQPAARFWSSNDFPKYKDSNPG